MLGYEVKELAAAARTSEQRTELQQKLADMFRAGSVPKSATHLFFINVLMHAESTKDTTLLDKAMVAAKEACAAEPMLMATVSRFESLAKQAK